MFFDRPPVVVAEVYTEMPPGFRRAVRTPWADANKGGKPVDCFLEGPVFDREGRLWLTDIPHGRIFRIAPDRKWELVVEYDGWPNGLALDRDGRLHIADYRHGVMVLDPAEGQVRPRLTHRNSERFKGVNDLTFSSDGSLWFTDQGQTGLHDPTGRVYRLRSDGRLDLVLGNVPSPNGLVLAPGDDVLWLAVTRDNAIWRCPVMPDGTLSKVHRFFTFYGPSGPDGLAVDEGGNLALAHAGMGSVFILDPHGVPRLQIRSPRGVTVTNLAYGGPDRRSLFMTDSQTGTVLRAPIEVPGLATYGQR